MTPIKVTYLQTPSSKARGLLGYQKAFPVLFTTRFGIHTFGLNFPIDVLILDSQNRIVRLANNLPANRIFVWPPIYQTVIELPAGFITFHRLKLGSNIAYKL